MKTVRQNDHVIVQVPVGHTLHIEGNGVVTEVGGDISANLSGWPVALGPLNRATEFRIDTTSGAVYDVRIDRMIGSRMVRCHSDDLPEIGLPGVIYETEGGWTRWDDYNGTYRDLDEASVVPELADGGDPVIEGTGNEGEPLTVVSSGVWLNRAVTYTYQWQIDGNDVEGETNPVFIVTAAADGEDVTCLVTASNIAGDSEPAESNAIEGIAAD